MEDSYWTYKMNFLDLWSIPAFILKTKFLVSLGLYLMQRFFYDHGQDRL